VANIPLARAVASPSLDNEVPRALAWIGMSLISRKKRFMQITENAAVAPAINVVKPKANASVLQMRIHHARVVLWREPLALS
jgi:hypothetical protein